VLFDHVKIAGSAKPSADGMANGDAGCGSIVNAVGTSMPLHRTNLVLIMSERLRGLPRAAGRHSGSRCCSRSGILAIRGAVAQGGELFPGF
jgi:hypothetical protein